MNTNDEPLMMPWITRFIFIRKAFHSVLFRCGEGFMELDGSFGICPLKDRVMEFSWGTRFLSYVFIFCLTGLKSV
jgi:hypothetical protein